MQKEFNRSHFISALLLLPASLFGVTFFFQISIGNPIAFMTLIAFVLFLVNSIWSFSTPFIIISHEIIYVKEALFKQSEILISGITSIDISEKNNVYIHRTYGPKVRIRLGLMQNKDRKVFEKVIEKMINNIAGRV